jgi:hypothetical protein
VPEGLHDSQNDQSLTAPDLLPLQQAWAEFCDEGGITEADFRNWLEGKSITRISKQARRGKKHLRLVATLPGSPQIQPAPRINNNDGPTEAA